MVKEVGQYWRRIDKEERDAQKVAEKKELERIKLEEERREAKRQQKKLNFLLTQTELFGHFISRKLQSSLASEVEETIDNIEESDEKSDLKDTKQVEQTGQKEAEEDMQMQRIVVPEGDHFTQGINIMVFFSCDFGFVCNSIFLPMKIRADEEQENKELCEAAKLQSSIAYENHLSSIYSFDQTLRENHPANIKVRVWLFHGDIIFF